MSTLFKLFETFHGKMGCQLYVASPLPRFGKDEFKKLLWFASEDGGFYSDLEGGDKIPGFQFKNPGSRSRFLAKARRMALESQPPSVFRARSSMVYIDGKLNKSFARSRPTVIVTRARIAAS